MKRFLIGALLLAASAYAEGDPKLFDLYQKGQYGDACDFGYERFDKNRHNEPFVSLLGFACLRADRIDRLAPIVPMLEGSGDARANSAYFSLLILQKRLLMQALYDDKPLSGLALPTSSHLLSKLFDLYLKNPKRGNNVIEYQDPSNPRMSYTLYKCDAKGRKTIAVDEYYDKILTVHHVY